MVLKFMFAFAQMIQRKATQKVRITRIKDIKKQSKLIKEEIKQKMNANKDNEEVQEECRVEMKMLEKDSPEFVQFYRMVAQTKNKTFDAGSSDEDNGGATGAAALPLRLPAGKPWKLLLTGAQGNSSAALIGNYAES